MDTEKIYLLGLTRDDLKEIIATTFSERFQTIKTTATVDEKKPLSIEEAAEFIGQAKQTLYKATSEGTIPFHKQGGKLWFFRDELISWIKNDQPAKNKLHLR